MIAPYTECNPISLPVRNSGGQTACLRLQLSAVLHLINPEVHLWSARFLHLCGTWPPQLHSFLLPSRHLQHAALWEKVINHNYLQLCPSPSHSSAHSVSSLTVLHPSIPGCPPVLFCSTLQEINVTVRPFIYLARCHRWEGTKWAPNIFP